MSKWDLLVFIIILVGMVYYLEPDQVKNIYNKIITSRDFEHLFSSKSKPQYFCASDNTTCDSIIKQVFSNCTDSIIILDTSSSTVREEFTKSGDTCHIYYYAERSFLSQMQGTSMTCDIPISKLNSAMSDDIVFWKYCQGSFKDVQLQLFTSMFGS